MLMVAVNKLHLSAGQLKLFPYLYFVCVREWKTKDVPRVYQLREPELAVPIDWLALCSLA